MAPKTAPERPWALHVMDPSRVAGDGDWEVWSTYRGPDKARERAASLIQKGYRARVVDTSTGAVIAPSTGRPEPTPAPCEFCGEAPHPIMGECLI